MKTSIMNVVYFMIMLLGYVFFGYEATAVVLLFLIFMRMG